jgi:hypothetical protein
MLILSGSQASNRKAIKSKGLKIDRFLLEANGIGMSLFMVSIVACLSGDTDVSLLSNFKGLAIN